MKFDPTPSNVKKLGARLPYAAKKEIERLTKIPYTSIVEVFKTPERPLKNERTDSIDRDKVFETAIEILKAREIPFADLMEKDTAEDDQQD